MHAPIRFRTAVVQVLAAGGLAALAALPAVAQDRGANDESVGATTEDQHCTFLGRAFRRLGEQRDGGADKATATRRVDQYFADLGTTGSHLKLNMKPFVTTAADFVFERRELNPIALGEYGFRSCRLHGAFAADDLKRRVADSMLAKAASACQQKYPGTRLNRTLQHCVRDQANDIHARLEHAQIRVDDGPTAKR